MAIPGNFFVILAIVIIVILLIASSSFYLLWAKNQTNVNMLISWYFLCFTVGIIVDCIRTIVIFGFGDYYPDLDLFGYIFKVGSVFVAFTLVGAIHLILSDYVGYRQPHRTFYTYYLIAIGATFAGTSIYWSFTTIPTESGFYLYQFEPILYIATFVAYFPVAVLLFFRNWYILRSIKNKKVQFKLILFSILTIFLIAERGFSLGGYSLVESVLGIPIEFSLLCDFTALIVIAVLFITIIVKYPGLMESIGTYFSIKKLYLLKDNGLLILEYDFEEEQYFDGVASKDTLIGGFIYAISEGFKEVLKSNEQIDTFNSGNRSVVIERGKYVFGVLIVTKDSPIMHQKLREFIQKYETQYKEDLELWTGEFSKFDHEAIQNWIFETLRER